MNLPDYLAPAKPSLEKYRHGGELRQGKIAGETVYVMLCSCGDKRVFTARDLGLRIDFRDMCLAHFEAHTAEVEARERLWQKWHDVPQPIQGGAQ